MTRPTERSTLRIAAAVALTHHEKWNGSGYPRGLAGKAIPIEGRIVAISDVFDALMSRRPYKRAFSEEETLSILAQGAGEHFDPAVHAAFVNVLDHIQSVRATFADQLPSEAELCQSP